MGGKGEMKAEDLVDPLSAEFGKRPFAHLRRIREIDPVHRVKALPYYLVTRYDDLLEVVHNPADFGSSHAHAGEQLRLMGLAPGAEHAAAIMEAGVTPKGTMFAELVHADPPAHQRQRRLVNRWFAPRAVERRWGGLVEQQLGQIMAAVRSKPSIELVEEVAVPLPVRVILDVLGLSMEHQESFKRWSDACAVMNTGHASSLQWIEKARAMVEMESLFGAELDRRMTEPSADLLSDLAQATLDEVDPETGDLPLTRAEALDVAMLMLVAGNETTTQLISQMMLTLAEHPGTYSRLRDDPSLIDQTVEEVLRYSSPVMGMLRFALRDGQAGNRTVPKDAVVSVMFGAANRDPAVFREPDTFDIDRSNLHDHVAFGHGIHYCLGAPLARLEARAVLRAFVAEVAEIKLDGAVEEPNNSINLRGLTRLPLSLEWVTAIDRRGA